MPSHHWARSFTVDKGDIEYLTNLLLERETPLTSEALALELIERRLQQEAEEFEERYKDALIYNPSRSYTPGEKLIFPTLDYVTATVMNIRAGENPDYGTFNVIAVEFDDEDENNDNGKLREFAANLKVIHELSENTDVNQPAQSGNQFSAAEILEENPELVGEIENALHESDDLAYTAGVWFPQDLMIEVHIGHINLAEAVLDINNGGPMSTEQILEEIGGIGKGQLPLQVFSMNHAMYQDSRFDEVGPAGRVLWYLARLEPPEVVNVPSMLRFQPIEHDRSLLTTDMTDLEAEIDDELSSLEAYEIGDHAVITLNYPHRRMGTLPLNAKIRAIFPTALEAPRIRVTLVDNQDQEEIPGWVVRNGNYVFGLDRLYRKHKLPIGAYVTVRKSDDPARIVIDFAAYRPRTEWIRLVSPKNNQITFENHKRLIGAEYDDLMILGAEDLPAVDALFKQAQEQRKTLVSILKTVIPELGRLTPQGTVHAKTIYSAVNVLRRCPPGPIFATLVANPDFQNVGGHYWKLASSN